MSIDILSMPPTMKAGGASGAKNALGIGEGMGATDEREGDAFSTILADVSGAEAGDPAETKAGVQIPDDKLPADKGTSPVTTGEVDETAVTNLLGRQASDFNPVQVQQVQQVAQLQLVAQVREAQVRSGGNLKSDLVKDIPLSSKTHVDKNGVLSETIVGNTPSLAPKLATAPLKEQVAVASRSDQLNLQGKVAQNDEVLVAAINRLAKHEQAPINKVDRASLVNPTQATSVSPGSPLLSKDLQTETSDTSTVLNDLEAPPKAAISPTPGLSMRQTVSRSTKEVSSSLPTEILQKAATDKAQRSTKEVQTQFSATVSEGRSSDTLADSKKVLPREIVSEMQSMEIRAPDPFSALMPGTRWKEQPQARSIFGREVVEAVQSPQSSSLNVTTASATTATVPLQSPTDVYVAEQVSFWISRDVQNAEMKLEGFGSDPVQVNISMNGNEAQVAFRTDELQVRNALENASAHLKEMLQQEGVVLSGVSVGSNGSGSSGNQEDKQRQGVKQTPVIGAQNLQPTQRRDSSQVVGRSLDLFV